MSKVPIYDAHTSLGLGSDSALEPAQLLEWMDEFGVIAAAICPSEAGIAYHFERENDYLLKAAQDNPRRFWPFLTAQPWALEASLHYLDTALQSGLVAGLCFDSSLIGCRICDPKFFPFAEFAQTNRLPIYYHTGTPIHALPTQLMFLASRYPEVRFIMGHMGFPDFWSDGVPVAEASPNIYLETSYFGVAPMLTDLVKRLGADRILFGSDVPTCSYSLEIGKIRALHLGEENECQIFGQNLLRMLGKQAYENC